MVKKFISEKAEQAKNYLRFILATQGKTPVKIVIENIPKVWSKFGDTENTWIDLPLPPTENATSCLFKGKKGFTFLHSHKEKEVFYILKPGGEVKLNTKKKFKIVKYPNGFEFKPNEIHLVEFLEDTELLCIWTPKFEQGWEATTFD